ncbi:MAG TPA: 5'-nucleotidase C-terminal domain-containing protein [Chroococcidiopsis sp.]
MYPILRQLNRRWALLVLLFTGFAIALLAPFAVAQDAPYTLRIIHTNDHHAHIEPVSAGPAGTLGGLPRRKTLFDQLRTESTGQNEPLLVLDAGDIFQGTLYFTQFKGQADLDFYNDLDYDAVTVGNHEFDAGAEALADFITKAEFPMLSANIEVDERSPLAGKIRPWRILNVSGERIGIFGLTPQDTALLSNPGAGVTFTDFKEAAAKAVRALRLRRVDKIIALSHVGITNDLQLAQEVNGIDVIVGGHSHTPLGNIPGAEAAYPIMETSPSGQPVVIVTDWEWGKYVGDVRVSFDPSGTVTSATGTPHAVDQTITPDPDFVAKVESYAAPLNALRQTVIGQAAVLLDGDRSKIRAEETNLANLITDAMLEKMRPEGAQMVITNGGGIRSSIPAGDVTMGQVLEVLPFGNTLGFADLTGQQVRAALEHGLSEVESGGGRFPQVAGLRYTWTLEAPVGERVRTVEFVDAAGDRQPLQDDRIYRVVTNNFMLTGGDGFTMFHQGQNPYVSGFDVAESVVEYIQRNSPVNPATDGRIQRQ